VNDSEELWTAACQLLREQVSDAVWLSTFQDVRALDADPDGLHLVVPSATVRDRITTRYLPLVQDALRDAGSDQVQLVLHINLVELTDADRAFDGILADSTIASVVEPTTSTRFDDDPHGPPGVNGNRQPAMTAAGLNPRYAFETFVKGQSNQFALAAAQRVAETPARSYNPLFIYGAAGLGKTHLLHAIGHYVNQNYSDYQIRYVSTETFLNEYVDAIRTNATAQFKRRYREIDVLLIDDIQFMEGKEGLQEEFFHTFNSLHGANKQIVISSDRIPDNIPTLEDRLRGRFKWGLITDIQPPDLETRLAILRNKAERDHTALPPDVLEFIATRITNNIRELEGALIRVTAYASLNRVPLTEEVAREVLADLLPASRPRVITPELILEETAKMFGWTVEDLCGKSRRRPLVTARQIGMYVFRELTDYSYPKIAEEFGGRDHTTVMHACEKIRAQMAERRVVFEQVNELISRIKHGASG